MKATVEKHGSEWFVHSTNGQGFREESGPYIYAQARSIARQLNGNLTKKEKAFEEQMRKWDEEASK